MDKYKTKQPPLIFTTIKVEKVIIFKTNKQGNPWINALGQPFDQFFLVDSEGITYNWHDRTNKSKQSDIRAGITAKISYNENRFGDKTYKNIVTFEVIEGGDDEQ